MIRKKISVEKYDLLKMEQSYGILNSSGSYQHYSKFMCIRNYFHPDSLNCKYLKFQYQRKIKTSR